MKDLLLVIDMQNVYAKGGTWCCPKAETAAANIKRLLKDKEDDEVIFTKFLAPKEPKGTWKEYNRINAEVNEDAYANEIMDIFSEDVKRFVVYEKSTYSSTKVPEVLEAAKACDRVILSGVVAECCVLATAFALIDEGIDIVYLTDAVAGIDKHTEEAAVEVLKGLDYAQVRLMTTDEYLTSMGKGEK